MSSQPLNLYPGKVLSIPPDIELLEPLGSGAFGSVWKVAGFDERLYALKVLQGMEPGSDLAERFRREAQVSVPSEHIVPVVGFREHDPTTYLILFEYFPARSLCQYLKEENLDDAQKRRIFDEILQGVGDAHRCNIIHRDLKPANILVGDSGQTKVIDFGIAKFTDRKLTKVSDVMGTLPWMAPEIFRQGAHTADARTDIYALGHIFYELAVGQHFWCQQEWGMNGLKEFSKYLAQTPPPTEAIDIATFEGGFFDRAAAVLARMVKIDPKQRYASIESIRRDLGLSVTAVSPPQDLHLRFPMLVVESGSNKGARTPVPLMDGERRILGRMDLAGNDDSISRTHLEFSRSGHAYWVRDAGSTNGTLLRGNMLPPKGSPTAIRHGDRIKVGDIFLRFVFRRR